MSIQSAINRTFAMGAAGVYATHKNLGEDLSKEVQSEETQEAISNVNLGEGAPQQTTSEVVGNPKNIVEQVQSKKQLKFYKKKAKEEDEYMKGLIEKNKEYFAKQKAEESMNKAIEEKRNKKGGIM